MEPEQSKTFLRVPQKVRKDSAFPFKDGEQVLVRIDPESKCLVVEKVKKKS